MAAKLYNLAGMRLRLSLKWGMFRLMATCMMILLHIQEAAEHVRSAIGVCKTIGVSVNGGTPVRLGGNQNPWGTNQH